VHFLVLVLEEPRAGSTSPWRLCRLSQFACPIRQRKRRCYPMPHASVLHQVVAQVRLGGVVAFQEPDWTGYRPQPHLPTWGSCVCWIIEALLKSGSNPYLGQTLYPAFLTVGLLPPALYGTALVAAGPNHPVHAHADNLVRSLLPAMERFGVANAQEVEVDTLAARLVEDAMASGATVIWLPQIGAAADRRCRRSALPQIGAAADRRCRTQAGAAVGGRLFVHYCPKERSMRSTLASTKRTVGLHRDVPIA
jgi:hypothetical protein